MLHVRQHLFHESYFVFFFLILILTLILPDTDTVMTFCNILFAALLIPFSCVQLSTDTYVISERVCIYVNFV